MKHGLKQRKLNRTSSHRLALLKNLSISLIKHETITTTTEKAKELRPFIIADDGVIEGAYNLEKKIICVQFHMENKGVSEKLTSNIMSKFLDLL